MKENNMLQHFSFRGDLLDVIQKDDKLWISLKRICEALGVDDRSQREKLQSKPWAVGAIITSTGSDGKHYEMYCIDLDTLPMWMATISPVHASVEARPKLITYQKEAARVLRDHFYGRNDSRKAIDQVSVRFTVEMFLLGKGLEFAYARELSFYFDRRLASLYVTRYGKRPDVEIHDGMLVNVYKPEHLDLFDSLYDSLESVLERVYECLAELEYGYDDFGDAAARHE